MESFCQFPFPLIPLHPTFSCNSNPSGSTTAPAWEFCLFYSFKLDFPAAFPDFPSSMSFAAGRESLLHSGIPEFPPRGRNSCCPWQPLIADGKSSLKFLFPPKSSNSVFFPRRKSGFLWFPDLQTPPIPFFP